MSVRSLFLEKIDILKSRKNQMVNCIIESAENGEFGSEQLRFYERDGFEVDFEGSVIKET